MLLKEQNFTSLNKIKNKWYIKMIMSVMIKLKLKAHLNQTRYSKLKFV
jgi:hypothetical protein